MSYKIGLIHDTPMVDVRSNMESINADKQKQDTKTQIIEVLKTKYKVVEILADDNIIENLNKSQIDIAFSLSTGVRGESRQAQIPAILEMKGIPYVGSGVLAHALALNKAVAKQVLLTNGVATPKFQVFYDVDEKINTDFKYPLIVKPACEGSGFGIHKDSVVYDESAVRTLISKTLLKYGPPVLVEEFIDGREMTVGIIGNQADQYVLPIMEIDFEDVPEEFGKFYTYEVKTHCGKETKYICPAPLEEVEKRNIESIALKAFKALGCKDFARVDIRFRDGKPYILELNSLPGLKAVYSDLPKMALVDGMSYSDLIFKIVDAAITRVFKEKDVEEYTLINSQIS